MNKKTATLDLTGCRYLVELHQRIREAFDFPEHYKNNWSAFWDCLNRDCGVDSVTIIGGTRVAKELRPSVKKMMKIFERNKQYWADSDCPFDYTVID